MSLYGNFAKNILSKAKNNGFMTEMPLYHGTADDIAEFSLEEGGKVSGSPVGKLGVSLATDPKTASEFAGLAGSEGANVIKAYHRASKPASIDLTGSEKNHEIAATVQDAWDQGFDAIKFNNYTTPGGETGRSFVLVKNPNQVRSVNANFDPKKINSANLTAGLAGLGLGAAAMTQSEGAMADQAGDMERLYNLYKQKGNKEGQLKVLRAMDKLQSQVEPPEQEQEQEQEQGIFAGLPEETKQSILERFPDIDEQKARRNLRFGTEFEQDAGIGPDLKQRQQLQRRAANLERIRMENPYLAEEIESMNPFEVGLIGAGKKTEDYIQGAGRLIGLLDAEDVRDDPGYQKLKSVRPAAGVGELTTDVAALAVPASKAAQITKVAPRVAATAGLEGTVAGLSTAGEGASGEEIAASAALGATIGPVASELAGPAFRNQGRRAVESAPGPYRSPDTGLAVESPDSIRAAQNNRTLPDIEPSPSLQPSPQVDELPVEEINMTELPKSARIREAITRGDAEAAGFRLSDNGRVVKDQLQSNALNEGFAPSTVVSATKFNPAEKAIARRILNKAQRYLSNPSEGIMNHPSAELGQPLVRRFNAVLKENKKARSLQKKALNDLKEQNIPIEAAVDRFDDSLRAMGYENLLTKQGKKLVPTKPTLKGNPGNKHLQVIDEMMSRKPTGKNLQELKDYLDEKINWNASPMAAPDKKISKQIENLMKDVRSDINQVLRQSSDDYAAANDTLSETIQIMNDFGDTMGKRFDIDKDNVSDYVGKQVRKVATNYASGDDMISAIGNLDAAAAKYGQRFDDNIVSLADFYNQLERRFGSFRSGSFQGRQEAANLSGAAVNVAIGNVGSAISDTARAGANRLIGRNATKKAALNKLESDRAAIRAMRELLR